MNYAQSFHKELVAQLDSYLSKYENLYPENEALHIDLHCHDHNSDVPYELLGRILDIPETWLKSEELMQILTGHGCNAFTVTNHNNARSCYELQEKGCDILTGAEFSCMVPDYKTGIHVLTYGFTQEQEKKLNKLRDNVYSFQEYTHKNDIPTIWAHPLYYYKSKGVPPLDFFEKMVLLFERFEVINGQRDTWQNMLVKNWIESMSVERIEAIAKKMKLSPGRYCRNPYRKSPSGGSDSHMGIFAGLTRTQLHVPDLQNKLKATKRSALALDAIKRGDMAPYGSLNYSEKMTVTFLDYFCQIAMNMKDPGLLRMILHKGKIKDKMLGLLIANGFAELKRHRVTMKFLEVFHDCFTGKLPRFSKRFFIPKEYKAIFKKATMMAETRRDSPKDTVRMFGDSIHFIYENLNRIFFERLRKKLETLTEENDFSSVNITDILDSFELPSHLRPYVELNNNNNKRGKGISTINLSEFLDGLSFPFLASAVIMSASFASARVLYNSRPLLTEFSDQIGALKHPKRMLWLTDTFDDNNGVAMSLKSMHKEIKKNNLPIDLIVCSSALKSDEHLIVVPPMFEFTFPFYEHQPLRIPNALDIHRIFREGEYDRLICSTEGPMGLISLFLKSAYTVPAYFYVHTDWIMFARKVLNLDKHNLNRIRRLIRAFYRGFDDLFVLNSDQQKWLTSRDMGFDSSRVFLTAHWADEKFKPQRADKAKIFGIEKDNPLLLFTGRISDEKGVMELPAIYKKVKETIPELQIAIAGAGPAEEDLKKELPDAIYMGWVDNHKLPEIYSAADLLLLPSKFDTFGCVVLEALSCGLPVVAYNTKGPKDIIENGKNGYLVKSRTEIINSVKQYLQDKSLQNSFKKAAVSRSRAYSAGGIITRFLNDIQLPNIAN